jgi:hypothetical protein
MSKSKQVALLLIATQKYKQFVQQLIDSANQFFCIGHDVTIILFSDEVIEVKSERIKIIQVGIQGYKFPHASLYRYKIFAEKEILLSQFDQIFYSDVDMNFVAPVGEEMFSDGLTATQHPGFYKGGWGSENNSEKSTSYLPKEKRKKYYAGGFNGGEAKFFLEMCHLLSANISIDENKGIIAEHNDEAHLNWFISNNIEKVKELHSGYCMVEDLPRRESWGISELPVKIIALNKDHKRMRS